MGTFIVEGLASRGGLSNWVAFIRDGQITLCDVGMGPAVAMGVAAGFGTRIDGRSFLPANQLDAWCDELCAKAKSVATLDDATITRVRLIQSFLPHELQIEEADGSMKKFGFVDRHFSDGIDEPLRNRFGSRFELVTTGPFAFLQRYLPFLLK